MKKVLIVAFLVVGMLEGNALAAVCVAGDTTPPTRIELKKISATDTIFAFSFIAPSDTSGVVAYDIRLSKSPISTLNFGSATKVTSSLIPAPAGTIQSGSISGLVAATTYYLAIKAQDACGRWSIMSNSLPFTTLQKPQPVMATVQWDYDDPSITGFNVYYGPMPRTDRDKFKYPNKVTVSKEFHEATFSFPAGSGRIYFSATAYTDGPYIESIYSDVEVSKIF